METGIGLGHKKSIEGIPTAGKTKSLLQEQLDHQLP